MKALLQKKSNLVILFAMAAAIVIAILCFAPIGQGGNGATSVGSGNAVLQNEEVPLSSGGVNGNKEGYEYEQSAEDGSASAEGENSADPYANSYDQDSGGTGNTNSNSGVGGDAGDSGNGGGSDGGDGGNDQPASTSLTATLVINASTIGRGDIMSARAVTFTEGESVFDVLFRECRASGIHMSSRLTPLYNSAYVEGIDNLYEFDGGELSGWMYSVNGWFPNYGCSQYYLSDGDAIAWQYTCDLGRDIGGEGATQG